MFGNVRTIFQDGSNITEPAIHNPHWLSSSVVFASWSSSCFIDCCIVSRIVETVVRSFMYSLHIYGRVAYRFRLDFRRFSPSFELHVLILQCESNRREASNGVGGKGRGQTLPQISGARQSCVDNIFRGGVRMIFGTAWHHFKAHVVGFFQVILLQVILFSCISVMLLNPKLSCQLFGQLCRSHFGET